MTGGAKVTIKKNVIKKLKVGKTYALQAGREVRVLVKPEEISDEASAKLAQLVEKVLNIL